MEFTELDAKAYRGLDTEAYQTRRALVLDLAGAMPEDATDEQIRSIDAELDIIKDEDARRDQLIGLRNHKMAQVLAGAGDPVATSDPAPIEQRTASLGQRVFDKMQERGISQGVSGVISNIEFRAAGDPNLNPAKSTDYYEDTLDDVNTDIRIGYRRPLSIVDLFGSEVTSKDSVSFYVEGGVEGEPALTAEGAAYAKLTFAKPTKKTNSLSKITAFWKNSDEIMSDSPRFVSHINAKAPYLMDLKIEDEVLSGSEFGLLATTGLGVATATGINMALVESLLELQQDIAESTPNFVADALVVSNADYAALLKLKDKNDQYILGGPTAMLYGNSVAAPIRTVWGNIRIVPSAAMAQGTMVFGAFKNGGTIIRHSSGRRFEMNYSGDDFEKGLVSFRTSERLTLAVEYPDAFKKITIS